VLAYAVLGIALLVGILLILRWFVSAEPKTLVRLGTWIVLGGVSVLAVVLAATGRLQWIIAAGIALLPWLVPLIRAARRGSDAGNGMSGGGNRTSDVETRFLRMSLDHDSGELDGTILEGPLAGARLSETGLADLLDLLVLSRHNDRQSAQVLEAYLDRAHPDWRVQAEASGGASGDGSSQGQRNGAGSGRMTPQEAYDILGLEPGADENAIKKAHHRLIANLHPDRGGTNYLAAKVNQARQVLLGR
jgi:DnaJ-domain-containing protein 1